MSILKYAQEQMANAGIIPVEEITEFEFDKYIRFSTDERKPHSKSGWLIISSDEKFTFGDFKKAQTPISCNYGPKLSKAEIIQNAQKQIRLKEHGYKEAANECRNIWENALPANSHSYLERKNVRITPSPLHALHTLKVHNGSLLIPIYRYDEREEAVTKIKFSLESLQYILPNGEKWFHPRGRIKGNFCPLFSKHNLLDPYVFLCEGMSTGLSIQEATGSHVFVTFNAGNLVHAAQNIARLMSHHKLIIAADNDAKSETNIGLDKAKQAAKAIKCNLIYPTFEDEHKLFSDFNDFANLYGVDELRKTLLESLNVKR